MPGGNVSVPTHRTVEEIKEDWDNMVKEGELTLGEPCYPHTLIRRYTVKGGELQRTETVVYGRKISLLDLREKLLRKHEPFMYLHTRSLQELHSLVQTLASHLDAEIGEERIANSVMGGGLM